MAQCTRHPWLSLAALLLFASSVLPAQTPPARFDLTGPKVEVSVTRAGVTLPIASVPNLQPGDQLRLHPDLPATQSVRYLLVAVFLRGTTNPPPDSWFFRIETWDKHVRAEGATITVPQEAQQAILFLAPETGGDFSTLRSAVRGRPGIFVRASQDLAEAGFEQARIEKYLAEIRLVPPSDPKALAEHSMLLARTLNLKPNEDCFKRSVDLQYTCLTQSGNQTLLDDGHGETVVASLTSGSSSDFINAASATSLAGGGTYSAYVGAIVDLVRITSNLHTAQYQYIPAIAFPQDASLNLRLNTPPSFHNPKSVIVIGLPSIQASAAPPLRPTDPKQVTCLLKPDVVFPVEGAPLVFSTAFAHDLFLHVDKGGASTDLPLTPDAFRGGLVLNPDRAKSKLPEKTKTAGDEKAKAAAASTPAPGTVTGTVQGHWGFDAFSGPTLQLQELPGKDWKIAADDPLIAGRENHLLLTSTASACIQKITLEATPGKQVEAVFKAADKPNLVAVDLPLKSADPGSLHLAIHQYGEAQPNTVAAKTFSEPATLASLQLHTGDTFATLTGTSLDEVQQMSIGDLTFTPDLSPAGVNDTGSTPSQTQASGANTLRLSLPKDAAAPKLKPEEKLTAKVTLKDGRGLTLPVTILGGRPALTLISKSISPTKDHTIHLASPDDLPVNQQLVFSLRSPSAFPRSGKIEVANADDSLRTSLTVAAGTLVLQDPHTLLATLDPLKTFGTSAFGPLRLRAVDPDGTAGDWIPLAVLVRLPTLTDIHCTSDASAACTLTGSSLYLVDAVGSDPALSNPTSVPAGFVGTTISIPRPSDIAANLTNGRTANTTVYMRLRDDPAAANSVVLPVLPQQ